jgi:hypothetical protein
MASIKKYANLYDRKTKELAIAFIISIIVISYGLFFTFKIILKAISEIAYLNSKNNAR